MHFSISRNWPQLQFKIQLYICSPLSNAYMSGFLLTMLRYAPFWKGLCNIPRTRYSITPHTGKQIIFVNMIEKHVHVPQRSTLHTSKFHQTFLGSFIQNNHFKYKVHCQLFAICCKLRSISQVWFDCTIEHFLLSTKSANKKRLKKVLTFKHPRPLLFRIWLLCFYRDWLCPC